MLSACRCLQSIEDRVWEKLQLQRSSNKTDSVILSTPIHMITIIQAYEPIISVCQIAIKSKQQINIESVTVLIDT